MRKSLFRIFSAVAVVAMASCTSYNIQGSSDLKDIDGRMLYLKDMVDAKVVTLDSCDMVHGKFKFKGAFDSVRVVTLCIDDQPIMPVVLESGDISISLNMQEQTCTGTPLNDTLTVFNNSYRQLTTQLEDLGHKQSQAIMNGDDMETVNRKLAQQEEEIMEREDKLVTEFITENFDNCLGPYVFQVATGGYEYPVLTTWIEALMVKATPKFKNDPYVKEYMDVATHNREIMMGTAMPPTPPMPPVQPPTPNQMAGGE